MELFVYFMYAVCLWSCTSTACPYKRVDIHIRLKIELWFYSAVLCAYTRT